MAAKRKAFITGITGQDGSYLAEILLEQGYEVYGMVRRSSSFNTARVDHIFGEIELVFGDLADGSVMNQLMRTIRPDEVYNLGAQSHVRVSFDIPEYTADIAGLGTLRLLDAIREEGVRCRFYEAGSSEMFGQVREPPQTEAIDDDKPALRIRTPRIEFSDVHFSYRTDEAVLHGMSFVAEPGKRVALIGGTGSGKSTIASLLFRHNDPQSGQVRVGGHDVRNLTLRALRQRIGLVTQQVHIFDASVRDNLTFFEPADDGTLAEILSSVGLGEWLGRLPAGLDPKISANSVSAGEAQLLAFARVFLKDPGLVILDEPSSRLDPATEAQVQRALGALLVDRTVILIAHRLDALRRTNEILVIDNGAIVERGPTASLLDDPDSVYAALLRTGALT